ncbi:hypothetical protein BT93_A1090 [Corymbia citriodora subsp. variegata]|nr:hypothetical protein BT93_A1090 [Corymbia citriodora subsp. variegata]
MSRLRLLIVRNVHNSFQGLVCLPNELRWFEWPGWTPEFSSCPKELVGLNMSKGNITRVVEQLKDFQNLRFINFSGCELLVRMPDFSCTPNLRQLNLQRCERGLTTALMSSIDQGSGNILSRTQSGKKDNQQPSPAVDFDPPVPGHFQHLRPSAHIPPKVGIFLYGGDMPEWVLPIEDSFVSFMTSEDLYDKFVGLVFCFVIDNGKKEGRNRPMFEILPQVNGEWRDGKGEEDYSWLTLDRIWFWYYTPNELWGEVKFGQIDGSHVQFSLTVRTVKVKKWGLRIICKPLENDLKVKIQENWLINPALFQEVVLESIYSEVESLFLHEHSSSEEDQQEDLRDRPMSSEELLQLSLMTNYELTLPQGMQTPVQPPEVQSSTHSGEQTSARTSSVGDSIAEEPEPEPIKNPSATGSGAASALTSATTPTTSTASIPSHGAAETVNLPSAQPSTVAEESEVSDVEMSDLEAIDKILGVVKPRRERSLPSGSGLSTPGAVDSVRAKWEQLYQLTREGYSHIASNSSVEDRIKNLLDELSSGDDCFTKTPKFQCECKEFATLFADGVEVFRQNCNKIESSTAAEESFNKLEDRLEAGKKILKERRSSYQAAIDKKGELTEEKERLEALLAEVERQIELNSIHIQHEGRSMKQQLSEVQATTQECHRQRAEVERHLPIKRNVWRITRPWMNTCQLSGKA